VTPSLSQEFLEKELPKVEQIINAIDDALLKIKNGTLQIDFLTFAGNGEPTLHPEYPKVVDYLLTTIKNIPLRLGTAIFTNGSQLGKQDILKATARLDQAVVKIDIVDREGFKKLNRPKINIDLDEIAKNASRLPNLRIQTAIMKVNGKIYDEKSLSYYCELLRIASPLEVQLYNIIYPPAEQGIEAVTKDELIEFADRLSRLVNINVVIYDEMEDILK
jgi:wyosine [tRNA(Phe)-imidazoG37] synthetase (radical SAM superfamily)